MPREDGDRLVLAEEALESLIEFCKGFGWVFATRSSMVDHSGLAAVNAKIDAWRAAREDGLR